MIKEGNRSPKSPFPAPSSPNPKITFELIDGQNLDIAVDWPEGSDVESFGYLLAAITQGKMLGPISAAVAVFSARTGRKEQGSVISSILKKAGSAAAPVADEDDDEPLVCPTQAIRMNLKMFQG
jgi:hypothetical protein